MRKTTPATVEITTDTPLDEIQEETTSDELNDFDWLEDFETNNKISTIRLGRFRPGIAATKQGFAPYLATFTVEDPPTLEKIKNKFGGGEYQLTIYQTINGRRVPKKYAFSIEGDPVINGIAASPVNGQNSNGNASISSANGSGDLIDTLIKLKQAGLIPDAKPVQNDNAILVESMKQSHEILMLMLTQKSDTSKDVILETLLKSALEKNKGELADFEKYANIFSKFQGGGAEQSEIMELVKAVAPALLPLLANRKPQAPIIQPRQLTQQPPPGPHTPPAQITPGNPVNNDIIAENERLKAKLNGFSYLENFSIVTLDEISDRLIPDDDATPGEDPHAVYKDLLNRGDVLNLEEFNFYLEKLQIEKIVEVQTPVIELTENNNLNNNTDMFGMFKGFNLDNFIQGLKTAPFDERVITLKQAANMFSKKQIYNFCLKHEVVSNLEDFNRYMHAAGIEPIPPTTSETT